MRYEICHTDKDYAILEPSRSHDIKKRTHMSPATYLFYAILEPFLVSQNSILLSSPGRPVQPPAGL
jgi:hypothetical protein